MSRTLTITVTDIPDGLWKDLWDDARRQARKQFGGFQVKETETMIINCDQLGEQCPEALHGLLSGAHTGNALYQFDQKYNHQG